jgi:proteasome alpha subunit
VDEPDFVVMGGSADQVTGQLREHFLPGMSLREALQVGVRALSSVSPAAGNGAGVLPAEQLEVAVLDRRRPKRAFRRVVGAALRSLLEERAADAGPPAEEPAEDATVDATAGATAAQAPSHPSPGTPAGLGDPAAPDTAGGTAGGGEGAGPQPGPEDRAGGGTEG